jgi:hypothetical protein
MPRSLVKTVGISQRNHIINSNFDFWQRGTSFTQGQKYTADRFWQDTNNLTTLSQQSSTPPVNSTFYARCSVTTGPGLIALYQGLEYRDVEKLHGKTVVFSVLIRRNATHSSGNFAIRIQTSATPNAINTGMANIASSDVPVSSVTTGTGTSDWTRLTVTATIPDGTNGLRFGVYPDANNATGAYWETAQWSVNEGTIVAPFELAGINTANELALCQRYYEKSYSIDTSPGTDTYTGIEVASTNTDGSTGRFVIQNAFKVTKRITPSTISIYSKAGTPNRIDQYNNVVSPSVGPTVSSVVEPGQNKIGTYIQATTTGWVNAEYYFHYTAEAEI